MLPCKKSLFKYLELNRGRGNLCTPLGCCRRDTQLIHHIYRPYINNIPTCQWPFPTFTNTYEKTAVGFDLQFRLDSIDIYPSTILLQKTNYSHLIDFLL